MFDRILVLKLKETPRKIIVEDVITSGDNIFESAINKQKIIEFFQTNKEYIKIRGKKNQIEYFNNLEYKYKFRLKLPIIYQRDKLISELFFLFKEDQIYEYIFLL